MQTFFTVGMVWRTALISAASRGTAPISVLGVARVHVLKNIIPAPRARRHFDHPTIIFGDCVAGELTERTFFADAHSGRLPSITISASAGTKIDCLAFTTRSVFIGICRR